MAATNRINQLEFWNDMFHTHKDLYTIILDMLASSDADNDKLLGWFILQADPETFSKRLEEEDGRIAAAIQSTCRNNAHIEQLWIKKLAEWKAQSQANIEIAHIYWRLRFLQRNANPSGEAQDSPDGPPALVASDDEDSGGRVERATQQTKKRRGRPPKSRSEGYAQGGAVEYGQQQLTDKEAYDEFLGEIHRPVHKVYISGGFDPNDATSYNPNYSHEQEAAAHGYGQGAAAHDYGAGASALGYGQGAAAPGYGAGVAAHGYGQGAAALGYGQGAAAYGAMHGEGGGAFNTEQIENSTHSLDLGDIDWGIPDAYKNQGGTRST